MENFIEIPLVEIEDTITDKETERKKEKKRLKEKEGWPEWMKKGFCSEQEFNDWITQQGLGLYLYHKYGRK